MNERMLKCKQCGLELPETEFKQYTSRSQGFRKTTTGRYTICKHCEKMSAYAAKLQKKFEAAAATDKDIEERKMLIEYYQDLVDRGLPLVTAPVRRLMGVEEPPRRSAQSTAMRMIAEAQQRRDANAVDTVTYTDPTGETIAEEHIRVSDPRDIYPKEPHMLTPEAKHVVEATFYKPVASEEPHMQTMDSIVDTSRINGAVAILNDLYLRELVREPAYYEAECAEALDVLRSTTEDGKVPAAYNKLASQVLERIDDYAAEYVG